MRWQIEPMAGLGLLKFGMSTADVALFDIQIGSVIMQRTDNFDIFMEYRSINVPNLGYVNNQLQFISTGNKMRNVFFDQIEIYEKEPLIVMRELEKMNGGAKIGLGVVSFENLCIDAFGFYFEDDDIYFDKNIHQDDRGLNVISKTLYSKMYTTKIRENFKNISFL